MWRQTDNCCVFPSTIYAKGLREVLAELGGILRNPVDQSKTLDKVKLIDASNIVTKLEYEKVHSNGVMLHARQELEKVLL